MESAGACEPSLLLNELLQGHELTRKLKDHLDESRSTELCKPLVQSIIASLEKALSAAKMGIIQQRQQHVMDFAAAEPESPQQSVNKSVGIGNSEHNPKDREYREMCKKRKAMDKWTRQVKACTITGLEGPPEDGSSWRKYGQKDILGAKYPRGYYRCTHRKSQGCLATKQVQRSDTDPTIFDITYSGKHSCDQNLYQSKDNIRGNPDYPIQPSLETVPKIKTVLDIQNIASPSFSFIPTPTSQVKSDYYNHIFSSPSTLDNQFTGSNCISPFISPATSEFDYFYLTPSFENDPINLNVLDSDLKETIYTGTSMEGLGFEQDSKNVDLSCAFDSRFFL